MQSLTSDEIESVSGAVSVVDAAGASFVGRGIAGAVGALVEGFVEGAELGSFGGPLGAAVGAAVGTVGGIVYYKYSMDTK